MKNFTAPLWIGFNCFKVAELLIEDTFVFTTQFPGVSGTYLSTSEDERMNLPWSHPAVLNPGLLDWESSALTTVIIGKMYVKCNVQFL